MADANKTLITRAEFTSTIVAASGRAALTFDGKTTEVGSFTGFRDITGLLTPGQVTSGRLLVARRDFQVLWAFDSLMLPAAAEGQSWAIISGTQLQSFRPFYTSTKDYKIQSDGHIVRLAVNSSGAVFVQFAKAARAISTVMETFTQAGWPSTLPGVADGEPVV
ncbi:hypothetical protein [Microbacterium resistens]|uniref:hypothetical protein n=1 Tax=Microbacterium resistens TaxID=156977 RepID=UPI00366ADB86